MKLASIALLACLSSAAFAQVPAVVQEAGAQKGLTVGEVIAVTMSLRKLKTFVADKDGKPVTVPYKFDIATLFKIARDIERGDQVARLFQGKMNDLRDQLSDGKGDVSSDKIAEFNRRVNALLDEPSGASMARLSKEELKLDTQPVDVETIASLLPILDP